MISWHPATVPDALFFYSKRQVMVASEQPIDDTASPQSKQEQEQTEPQHQQHHSWGAPEVKPEVVESLEGDESEKGPNEHRDQKQHILSAVHSTAPPLKFCPEVCIVLISVLVYSWSLLRKRFCLVKYNFMCSIHQWIFIFFSGGSVFFWSGVENGTPMGRGKQTLRVRKVFFVNGLPFAACFIL
jgi:hypothetical protein